MNIVYEHYRVNKKLGIEQQYHRHQPNFAPAERGGRTICILLPDEVTMTDSRVADILGIGVARCSIKDNFCYKLGRTIAFGRAMKDMAERE